MSHFSPDFGAKSHVYVPVYVERHRTFMVTYVRTHVSLITYHLSCMQLKLITLPLPLPLPACFLTSNILLLLPSGENLLKSTKKYLPEAVLTTPD